MLKDILGFGGFMENKCGSKIWHDEKYVTRKMLLTFREKTLKY